MNFFFALFCTIIVTVNSSQIESQLIKDRLKNYDPLSRPVREEWSCVNVTMQISLHQLVEVNERKNCIESKIQLTLFWKDEHLAWDPRKFGNISQVTIYIPIPCFIANCS